MDQIANRLKFLGTEPAWIIEGLVLLAIIILANIAGRVVIAHFCRKFEGIDNLWIEALLEVFLKPFSLFVWVIGISYALVHLSAHLWISGFLSGAGNIGYLAAPLCISWLAYRWQRAVTKNFAKKQGLVEGEDWRRVDIVCKLVSLLVIFFTILIVLELVGVEWHGLLAITGVGGFIVGYAGKDALANFFGGLMIYLTRPFSVGESIKIPERNIEGTVEEVGWYLTLIRGLDKKPLYAPNSIFSTLVVINLSRITHLQIHEVLKIGYQYLGAVPGIIRDIESFLVESPHVETVFAPQVYLSEFGLNMVSLKIKACIRGKEFLAFARLKQEVMLRIMEIIAAHGVDMSVLPTAIELTKPRVETLPALLKRT